MNLKLQLKILSFLQFCLWGSWLTTLGSYMFVTLKFDGASIGAVYSSLGIAAVFTTPLALSRCSWRHRSRRRKRCSL